MDKIIYVEENESLEEMLQKNLSSGRANVGNESDRLISGAFLEWFLNAFPYLYYGLIESPEVTANITEILSNRMYDFSAGSGACRQEIVEVFDKDVYAVDFDVYHEEAFADLCGKLSARKKALEPVAGLLDECRKKLGDKQRFEIGSIVCGSHGSGSAIRMSCRGKWSVCRGVSGENRGRSGLGKITCENRPTIFGQSMVY